MKVSTNFSCLVATAGKFYDFTLGPEMITDFPFLMGTFVLCHDFHDCCFMKFHANVCDFATSSCNFSSCSRRNIVHIYVMKQNWHSKRGGRGDKKYRKDAESKTRRKRERERGMSIYIYIYREREQKQVKGSFLVHLFPENCDHHAQPSSVFLSGQSLLRRQERDEVEMDTGGGQRERERERERATFANVCIRMCMYMAEGKIVVL